MKIYVSTKNIKVSPFVVAPGQHSLTIYLIEHEGKRYAYYKCTKMLSELNVDIKSKFVNPVIILSPKKIQEFADLNNATEVVVLKHVAFETILQFLASEEKHEPQE